MTDAQQNLSPYEPLIITAVEQAFREAHSLCRGLPPSSNARTRRNIMYDFLTDELRMMAEDHPEIEFRDEGQNFFIRLRTTPYAVLRFNHGNGGAGYATNPTFFTRDYDGQYELAGMEAGVHLRVLYLTDELEREITGIKIVCPNATGSAAWSYDLDMLVTADVEDLHGYQTPAAAPLRPKKGLKKKKNVG